jgi:hypothetical protein
MSINVLAGECGCECGDGVGDTGEGCVLSISQLHNVNSSSSSSSSCWQPTMPTNQLLFVHNMQLQQLKPGVS